LDFQSCITALEKCEKPIIILLHGISYGLAIDMSSACDIRLATRDARMAVKEVDIGLAADIGTLTRLPKIVGNLSWVKEVAYSARDFSADEALRVGFVSAIAPSKEEGKRMALEMCRRIAEKSPVAVLGTKEIINFSRDHSIEDGLMYTGIWNAAMVQTEDVKRAMLSGIKKKKPTFEKL
jgi:delta(3,5)-delta(2,4)-dienoyl-CoA isomerase